MENWHEVYWLTKFRMKRSWMDLLTQATLYAGTYYILVFAVPYFFNERTISLDFFFILIFSLVFKNTESSFKTEYVSNDRWAVNTVIALNQLAIKKSVIANYRFLFLLVTTIPMLILLLFGLYFSPAIIKIDMSISSYIVFSIMWLAFSMFVGSAIITYEAGMTNKGMVRFGLLGIPLLLLLYFFIIFKLYKDGIVQWTAFVATNFPLLATSISVFLAVVGLIFWRNKMISIMKTTDYLH